MSLLLEVFRCPDAVCGFDNAEWNRLIAAARASQVLGRLSYALEDRGLPAATPVAVRGMLEAARARPAYVAGRALFEARKVLQAVKPLGCELVLLKGAAYAAAGLPLALGRLLADLDCLVPARLLAAVEQRLRAAGWQAKSLSAYDQRYYREWMHELPPLTHPARGFEVDMHHDLLPRTGRLRPVPEALLENSVALPQPGLRVLSPPDMLLHTAAHLFYDGAIEGGFKDLLDAHLLILHFGPTPGFWDLLAERAALHQLRLPLHHTLRFARQLLGSPVPDSVFAGSARWASRGLGGRLMGTLVVRVLPPPDPPRRPPRFFAWLLYLRSHWLRMPPGLLATHLLVKSLRRIRLTGRGEGAVS